MTRTEFRFSGFGGQGVITMAHVVGHAAITHEGWDATMTEAYGPEKTGGFSRGDVVVSPDRIDYPGVIEPDVVVAFAQDAFARDAASVAPDGLLVVERDLVDPSVDLGDADDGAGEPVPAGVEVVEVPAVAEAEELGRRVVANVVMLGAVVGLVGVPSADAVRRSVEASVPAGTEALNLRAFDRGAAIATGAGHEVIP